MVLSICFKVYPGILSKMTNGINFSENLYYLLTNYLALSPGEMLIDACCNKKEKISKLQSVYNIWARSTEWRILN